MSNSKPWLAAMATPEFKELKKRQRRVATSLSVVSAMSFVGYLAAFGPYAQFSGSFTLMGVPFSILAVLAIFALTLLLVFTYLRLARTYIEPAQAAAVEAIERRVARPP